MSSWGFLEFTAVYIWIIARLLYWERAINNVADLRFGAKQKTWLSFHDSMQMKRKYGNAIILSMLMSILASWLLFCLFYSFHSCLKNALVRSRGCPEFMSNKRLVLLGFEKALLYGHIAWKFLLLTIHSFWSKQLSYSRFPF